MGQFSKLSKLDVKRDRTAEFTFFQLEGRPSLRVRPAEEVNKAYFNALLKRRSRRSVRRIRAGSADAAQVAENRAEDRELYAKHVVVGWSGVKNDSGVEVPFGPAPLGEFLAALPDWLFDELRLFCSEVTNFVDEEEPQLDVEETAGN